jgi:(p)ppGpp synthase/HD superfamily hydrolase
LVYAADLHRNQTRKATGIPYIAHLLSVSSRVLSAGGTEVQAIAGLLHDAAENQGGDANCGPQPTTSPFAFYQLVHHRGRPFK